MRGGVANTGPILRTSERKRPRAERRYLRLHDGRRRAAFAGPTLNGLLAKSLQVSPCCTRLVPRFAGAPGGRPPSLARCAQDPVDATRRARAGHRNPRESIETSRNTPCAACSRQCGHLPRKSSRELHLRGKRPTKSRRDAFCDAFRVLNASAKRYACREAGHWTGDARCSIHDQQFLPFWPSSFC
jgi:hypothetical protein